MVRVSNQKLQSFHTKLQDFYSEHGRHGLPWRTNTSAYRVLVSEIMLQQTQVDRVLPKYKAFIKQWSNWKQLAAAQQSEVLRMWKGLGYNSRALRLQQLAKIVTDQYRGRLPRTRDELESLPGIGPYTAGAVRAFVWNDPGLFIETNIRRVFLHHFFQGKEEVDDKEILQVVKKSTDTWQGSTREYYWALMDYGAYLGRILGRSNPNQKSRHYTRQSKFAGSNRQLRGRILDELLQQSPLAQDQLIKNMADLTNDHKRIEKILSQLAGEGFIQIQNNQRILLL